jgi:hypothetical protein
LDSGQTIHDIINGLIDITWHDFRKNQVSREYLMEKDSEKALEEVGNINAESSIRSREEELLKLADIEILRLMQEEFMERIRSQEKSASDKGDAQTAKQWTEGLTAQGWILERILDAVRDDDLSTVTRLLADLHSNDQDERVGQTKLSSKKRIAEERERYAEERLRYVRVSHALAQLRSALLLFASVRRGISAAATVSFAHLLSDPNSDLRAAAAAALAAAAAPPAPRRAAINALLAAAGGDSTAARAAAARLLAPLATAGDAAAAAAVLHLAEESARDPAAAAAGQAAVVAAAAAGAPAPPLAALERLDASGPGGRRTRAEVCG